MSKRVMRLKTVLLCAKADAYQASSDKPAKPCMTDRDQPNFPLSGRYAKKFSPSSLKRVSWFIVPLK